MRVVVPALDHGSHAHLALTAEAIPHTERLCVGDDGYSHLVAELWRGDGGQIDGFILVEHDIAPWFGAVRQLADCEGDWCAFRYPRIEGALSRGLGCVKFSKQLIRRNRDLWREWEGTDWRNLDGVIGTAVAQALRREFPHRHPLCTHNPPVAHVRRLGD